VSPIFAERVLAPVSPSNCGIDSISNPDLNDYAKHRARQLAGMGYTALAVDMYGDGKTADHTDDAGKFAAEMKKHMVVATVRFQAARALLAPQPTVDPGSISAIGYCVCGGG
jgi:dienelactone hydrolase